MLGSAPRLNPGVRWTALDSGHMLVVYERAAPAPVRWLRRLFLLTETAELLLDPVGAKVIRRIDGSGGTVGDLIEYIATDLKMSRGEAEMALLTYLGMLGRRNLVGFELRPRPETPQP